MNKQFIAKNVCMILLLTGILIISSAFAHADDKENIYGNIDFIIDSNDIEYTDYYLGKDIIAVDSTGYTFEKDYQFIDEPVCLQWNRERINGTWVDINCENWDTQQTLDKVVLAKLHFKTCEEGAWYRIYRSNNYYTTKEDIIANGQYFDDVQCIGGKVSFEVEDFSSYTQEQIDDLIVGNIVYYSFDNDNLSGSNPLDSSASGNDGTNFGAATNRTGILEEAFAYDGTNDYVRKTSTIGISSGSAWSMGGWFRPESLSGQRYLLQPRADIDARLGINNGQFEIAFYDGTTHTTLLTGTVDSWQFVVATYDGSTLFLRINETTNTTAISSSAGAGGAYNFGVGANFLGSGNYFNGTMDEVFVWDKTLNTSEMDILFNGGAGLNPYKYVPTISNVSYLGIPVNVSDFSFASSTDVLFSNSTFNVSENNTDVVFFNSYDLIKTTGSGTSDVSVRIDLDGITKYDDVIRTLTKDQYGVSGTPPLFFPNVQEGSHSVEAYIRRTGNGNIDVTNIGEVLLQYETTSGIVGRGNVTNITATISSTTMTSVWNKTIDKVQNASTYITGTLKFTSALDSLAVCQFRDGNVSPYMIVDVPAGTTKSIAMNYITDPPQQSELLELYCNATSGTTVSITGSVVEADKKDDNGNEINFVSATNSSTNYTNTVSLGAGHTDYLIKEITLANGTGVFISGSISFASGSGAHTPLFHVNVTDNTNSTVCEFEKERYSDGLVGNVYFYRVCDGLTVGDTYTIELGVTVAAGENITIYDESWSTFEVSDFAVTITNIAPFVAITYPTDNLRVNETVEVNWTASDFNGDRFVQNVTLNNATNTTILEQNLNDTTFTITFNSANFSDGIYNLTVSVCENESAELLCNEDVISINITQSIVVPVIGGEFTVNECPVDSTALSIVFFSLIVLVLGIIIIALLLKSGVLVMGSSMGLFIMGWFIAGCIGAMSGVVTFIAISLFVFGITMKNI